MEEVNVEAAEAKEEDGVCLPLTEEVKEDCCCIGIMAVIMEAELGEGISEATGVASESVTSGLSTSLLFDARELRLLKQPML